MIRKAFMIVATTLLVATAVTPVLAQTTYPDVSALDPFSAESNFMSRPGYLRWVTFQQTSNWLSYVEAERIVVEQTRTAGR